MLKRIPHAHRTAFLELLRALRLERKVTQAELAKRLGREQNFVSLYERGVRRLDLLEVREICKALAVPFSSFIQRLEKSL